MQLASLKEVNKILHQDSQNIIKESLTFNIKMY